MTKKILLLLLSPIICSILLSCKNKNVKNQKNQFSSYPVVAVSKGNYSIDQFYPTAIEGNERANLQAKNLSYIKEVFVDEGEFVKKGTPLFKLESFVLDKDAESAKSQIRLAQIELEKLLPLFKKGIVSNYELETAMANLNKSKSQYQSIMANISYSFITSPYNGVIGKINYRKGNLVGPNESNPLTTISKIDSVFAYFTINEKEYYSLFDTINIRKDRNHLSMFPEVSLILPNDKYFKHNGEITAYSGNIENTTGSLQFRALFPNPNYLLKDGSSGSILLPKKYIDVIAIPAICTFEIQNKTLVYIFNSDSTVNTREVFPLGTSGKMLLIEKNLKEGEIILARGLNKIRPGTKIIPIPTTNKKLTNSYQTYFPVP
ncbi:MAG: efflux RND transporter periplasmic adaptor subunit [Bacteroidales bacterium]